MDCHCRWLFSQSAWHGVRGRV